MSIAAAVPAEPQHSTVPLASITREFLKISLISFGGAAAQIALMHRVVVEEKRWIEERRYLDALNFCMLLPGPEAQQLATYVGWRLAGIVGGLVSGIVFVLPGALIMLGLSILYVYGRELSPIESAFFGIKAAVLALIAQAILRLRQRALGRTAQVMVALACFALLLCTAVPFPLLLLGAAVVGLLLRGSPAEKRPAGAVGSRPRFPMVTVGTCLIAWVLPVALAAVLVGSDHLLTQLGLFFSKLAAASFGGAYALLAWLAQDAVEIKGWLSVAQMTDGLGLAETTPGPTILVTQFVAFVAAFESPGSLNPLEAALLASGMATWVTFAPSFLWIFAGAPYLERLRGNALVASILAMITAAVIGAIAYLGAWFAVSFCFRSVEAFQLGLLRLRAPVVSSIDFAAVALTTVAFLLVFQLRLPVLATVGLMAVLGLLMGTGGWL